MRPEPEKQDAPTAQQPPTLDEIETQLTRQRDALHAATRSDRESIDRLRVQIRARQPELDRIERMLRPKITRKAKP